MEFTNINTLNPKSCISGQMNRINRMVANVFRKHLSPFNITDSQLTILFILSKREGLNQKKLCDIALLEKSTLNRNLNRLYEKNYISKTNSPLLSLTTEGKHFVNSVIPEWEKAMKEVRSIIEFDGEDALRLLHTKFLSSK